MNLATWLVFAVLGTGSSFGRVLFIPKSDDDTKSSSTKDIWRVDELGDKSKKDLKVGKRIILIFEKTLTIGSGINKFLFGSTTLLSLVETDLISAYLKAFYFTFRAQFTLRDNSVDGAFLLAFCF